MTALLQIGITREVAVTAGIALTAAGVSGVLALVYRWYAAARLPSGLGLLSGFAVVSIHLNTTAALGQVIANTRGLLDLDAALLNTATFAVAGIAAVAGLRAGDRAARSIAAVTGTRTLDAEVSRMVTAVGRVIAVEIPGEIEDIEGYDPVPPETKEALAGKTLLFPRRLTVAELRDRLVTRLKQDYGVGHVSLDLADDGTIEYLGVGSRAAGLGPTLPPGSAATAIRADPPYAASSGDAVQVWSSEPDPERIATAEVRAKADDVVTLALDETDAESLDPDAPYRLLTLPADVRADREFASLLRAADETFGVVTVEPGSPLVDAPVGALDPTVVGIRPGGGSVEAIPPRSRHVAAGDTIYVVARPEALRRLETAARAEAEPSS